MENENKALIFNKVQGSFVDGWGIRTTIFLKGCPLRCKWCCNPEGQSFEPELKVTYEKCNGCGRCVDLCPQHALTISDGLVSVDRKLCNVCGECEDFCWTGALEPFGRYYSVDEMFDFLKRDIEFYTASGGGVTIGGGEAACQPDFVLPLIEKCHDAGIKVAIDTCGYVSDPRSIEVYKKADLLLYDIKGMNPVKHKENTGVSNELIWANLRMMGEIKKPIIIRMPIIPGYNDSDEEIRNAAEALKEIQSVERIDIIPIHHFGKVKYKQIGLEYQMDTDLAISEERQQQIKDMISSYGFRTQIGG